MLFQSVMDPRTLDVALTAVKNAYTATLTITQGSIAIGSPVVVATHSASLPQTTTDSSVVQSWGRRPATSTDIMNNLVRGLLYSGIGTKAYLDREEVGLVMCHGIFPNAIVQVTTSAQAAGLILIPESLQFLTGVTGPVTAASTGTAANVEVPALGGLFALIQSIASSAATDTARKAVLVRCM